MESIALILPIDQLIPQIPATGNLVIEAAPGAGKTTRVPAALPGNVLVLEPRRLAARLAARRVASERGEQVGDSVGYQVRFEDVSSPRTHLRYLTEGVLNRRLATDPLLRGIDAVVLDEFHERHLEGDLALALLLELQRTQRPEIRIVVMSATLDAAPIAVRLGGCPVLRSEGRLFPLEQRYTPESAQPLEERVAAALEKAQGDALIFLPGAAEIRKAIDACRRLPRLLLPLYGELPQDEQDRALEPASRPKAIFATNIAESSITIPGITTVIDSGLARVASDSKSTGLPQLTLQKISRASCIQRAGRAARTGPGLCIRLYTEQDFLSRPERATPEILSRELSGLLLQLRAMGLTTDLPWMSPPGEQDIRKAEALLDELGAHGDTARRMAAMPLHPRLARMMLEAAKRGSATPAARVAALLSSGERAQSPDLIHSIERPISPHAERIAQQLERQVGRSQNRDWERGLAESILSAYPDRVAKRRREDEYELAGGTSTRLTMPSPPQWIVAVDLDDKRVRAACPIEPDWLLELFPQSVEAVDRYVWNRVAERIEQHSAMEFHGLVLASSIEPRPTSEAATNALRAKVRESGWRRFINVEEAEAFLARAAFAKFPFGEAELLTLLLDLCEGCNGFDQVREAAKHWTHRVNREELDRLAPVHVKLRGKQTVPVNYVPGQAPWIASRLQDFWGMTETPKVGGVPVLVHLLGPNKRPLQMTQDLGSFWKTLYPQLRQGLSRRYPKHQWPE